MSLSQLFVARSVTSISDKGNSIGFSSTKVRDSGVKTDERLPEHACTQQAAYRHDLVSTGAAVDPSEALCQALM